MKRITYNIVGIAAPSIAILSIFHAAGWNILWTVLLVTFANAIGFAEAHERLRRH